MELKIRIAVLCYNRKAQTAFALETLKAAKGPRDTLVCYDDGSTEYDEAWLKQWADFVYTGPHFGTEAQRRNHLIDFANNPGADLLYFTDNDTIHDPTCFEHLKDLQARYGHRLVCGYNTEAHVKLQGNTIMDDPTQDVIWRHYAPGVSYLLTRLHVQRLLPFIPQMTAFDWNIPDILHGWCAISRVSYLDHIGYGGLRHPADEGYDGGDRALNPTDWLIAKRAEVVAKLKA
jgi:hypothetical protein